MDERVCTALIWQAVVNKVMNLMFVVPCIIAINEE
jgi:hypothetical protein